MDDYFEYLRNEIARSLYIPLEVLVPDSTDRDLARLSFTVPTPIDSLQVKLHV